MLTSAEVEKLVSCSDRTVVRARKALRELKKTLTTDEGDTPTNDRETEISRSTDPVELLMQKCTEMLCRANPNPSWANCLKDILVKTGKLDIKIQAEEVSRKQLQKLSPVDLVRVATGQELPVKSLETKEEEGSIYS